MTPKIALEPDAAWPRLWIPAPHLRRTYIVFAVPGGAAAESRLGIPAGMCHVLEHLFYRQNGLAGHPLDRLGAKFGLETRAEVMYAFCAVDPEDAPLTVSLLDSWWRTPSFPPEPVEQEVAMVVDEISQSQRAPARRVWRELLRALAPSSHLALDFGGTPEAIRATRAADVARYHALLRDQAGTFVALGPQLPWEQDVLPRARWRPSPIESAAAPSRVVHRTKGLEHAIVASGRLVAGLAHPHALGSYAALAALRYGRVHPAQRALHLDRGLRYVDAELRMFAERGVLAVTARCAPQDSDVVADLVESILADPAAGSDDDRLRRCAKHHLEWSLDHSDQRVVEEGFRALHGAPTLASVAEGVRAASGRTVRDAVERHGVGPIATVVFRG
jgi:predicted Zn-dependent peptidase